MLASSRLQRVTPAAAVHWAAVLVRPDGYIAWSADRHGTGSPQPHAELTRWFGPGLDG